MTNGYLNSDAADECGQTPCMTVRQTRFVEEYLIDLNATQAAPRAGHSPKTAYSQGQRLLKHPNVAEAIGAATQERTERLGLQADDVVLELTRIAFSDIGDFVDWDSGNVWLKELHEIPPESRRAIAGVTRSANGLIQVRLHAKVRALDMLAKHIGMYDIRREPTSRVGDASLLTDDELVEIIREERAAKAARDGHEDDEKTSIPS